MALREPDRLLPQEDAQQTNQRDHWWRRRAYLNEPVSHPNDQAGEERGRIAGWRPPLFLRPQHDAPSRPDLNLAVSLLRLAAPPLPRSHCWRRTTRPAPIMEEPHRVVPAEGRLLPGRGSAVAVVRVR